MVYILLRTILGAKHVPRCRLSLCAVELQYVMNIHTLHPHVESLMLHDR